MATPTEAAPIVSALHVRGHVEANRGTHYVREDGRPLCGTRAPLDCQDLQTGVSCARCRKIAERLAR